MATYGNIYKLTDYDRLNSLMEVSIQKKDYTGSVSKVILDGVNPVEIKYNLKKRVYGTGIIINILNDFDDKFLFAKMIAEPYETYKLKVEVAGNICFEGFLLPQTFNQDVRYKSYVALTFGNGLRMLENITPSFLTTGTDDYITEMNILINIFSYLNLNYTIYVNSTLYEDSMSAPEKADNPLKVTYDNRLAFQENDGDWDDALTILNKILTSINAYCYIRGERIMIERFVDKANNPKTFWTYNPVTETHSSTVEAFTEKTLDHIVLEAKSFRYQIDQPIKKLKLKLNLLTFSNILSNNFDRNFMSDDLAVGMLFYWVYSTCIRIDSTNFSNAFITRGIAFGKQAECFWDDFGNSDLIYQSIFTNKNDDVIFNFQYKFWGTVVDEYALDFKYRLTLFKIGGALHYVNEDGTISHTIVDLTEAIENDSDSYKFDFNISKTFDLTGNLNAHGLTGDVYIAIRVYPPKKYVIGSEVKNPVGGIYGDFSLNQDNIRINNLLEADLNNEAFKTIDEKLDLYDVGYVNYRTQKLLEIADGYKCTANWTDNIHAGKSLQQHYILNRGNLYNSSCAILNLTIIDKTIKVNIDDIFVFNNLEDDLGNPMKFYVDDLTYNVKQHNYKIKLKQWLANVGKIIV